MLDLRQLVASSPGACFHGSATPTQTMSAPASTRACASACPIALLPSVISTLRNFGSLVISRSIGSSAMFAVSCGGSAISAACPLLSRCARTRTRDGAPRNRRADARAGSARRRAAPVRAAAARARDSKARSSDAARCRRSARPRRRPRAIRADATGNSRRPSAADTARCRNRSSVCSSKRPSAAAAVSRSAARLRAPGGKVGSRNARTGLRGFGLVSGSVMRAPGSRRRCTGRDRS